MMGLQFSLLSRSKWTDRGEPLWDNSTQNPQCHKRSIAHIATTGRGKLKPQESKVKTERT